MKNKLKLDVICNDGSPLGVGFSDVYGNGDRLGVGGAELALLVMCDAWHRAGHKVRLYNSPIHANMSKFPQYPIDTFIPKDKRDILIIFRSPNFRANGANGKKVWWSCDQYTVGDFRQFATGVDKIVTISPFHAEHFRNTYGIVNTTTIDLPVILEDYSEKVEKVKHRMIFCSVPDRGLATMARAYPVIKSAIPDASLIITSDYRLWGVPEARNERFLSQFMGMDGVRFLGGLPRKQMVMEQMQAEVQSYPCLYDELFCIANAECQVAGAFPVTSTAGALRSTNMGIKVEGDYTNTRWTGEYATRVIETLTNPLLREWQVELQEEAKVRFSLEKIMKDWDKVFSE